MSSASWHPKMVRVRQKFATPPALDLAGMLRAEFTRTELLENLPAGARVAVGVGSRGIDRLSEIVDILLRALEQAGARPFLFPAMGSHGGATAAGQERILAEFGITPATLGVDCDSSMETDLLAPTPDGIPVHAARAALHADAILVVNRVKPHTDFGGALGSGLLKMAVVGVGKHAGAKAFHQAAQRHGHEHALRSMAAVMLQRAPFLGGVAIIEDATHRLARLEVVPSGELEQAESRLASEAAGWMPRLPLEEIDLLIIDRIGKDISGTGLDPNITGRPIHGYSLIESELPNHPRIRRIFVRDLSPGSHGNANGIGMADFTTTRLVQSMDSGVTYTNSLAALSLQGSKIPIHFPSDREVLQAALPTLGLESIQTARVVRIQDTLSLETLEVSEACLPKLRHRKDVAIMGKPAAVRFDSDGNLL